MPFSWSQRLITVYIRPHYWILTSARFIQYVSTYRVALTSFLYYSLNHIYFFPSAHYPSGPAPHSTRMSHLSHITTYPVHITALYKITLTLLVRDWMPKNSVPIEKPTEVHPIETFSAPDGTRRLITVSQDSIVLNEIGKGSNLARRVVIVVTENQQCVLCVLLSYKSLSTILLYSVLHKNNFMVNLFLRRQ
jgi:hypothetical protein